MIASVTRYSATITAGGLMLPDARRVAALMQSSPTHEQWVQAIGLNNLLQKKAPATASRKANLIRARCRPGIWGQGCSAPRLGVSIIGKWRLF